MVACLRRTTRNSGLMRARSVRNVRAPSFFDPALPTKSNFLVDLVEESRRAVTQHMHWKHFVYASPKNLEGHKKESYRKDHARAECANKKLTNGFLAKHAESGFECLVLDGARARTSKRLLKRGVASILIPNNSTAVIPLRKFADSKAEGKVRVVAEELHEVLKTTKKRFDILYLDTCGFFTTGGDSDLKSSIALCSYRNLLKEGGIFGVTITSRTNGQIVNAKQLCRDWIEEKTGLSEVFTHTYGQMTTMFFK
jgi:hypothetical protein